MDKGWDLRFEIQKIFPFFHPKRKKKVISAVFESRIPLVQSQERGDYSRLGSPVCRRELKEIKSLSPDREETLTTQKVGNQGFLINGAEPINQKTKRVKILLPLYFGWGLILKIGLVKLSTKSLNLV